LYPGACCPPLRWLHGLILGLIGFMISVLASAGQPPSAFRDCEDCPEMVTIPPGAFVVGDVPGAAEGRSGTITFGRAFAMGKTEITERQWRALMGEVPDIKRALGDDFPVGGVSWDMAADFARRLLARSGVPYRLPSEAEWEYACRAGARTRYCGGENVDMVSWYVLNPGSGSPRGYLPHAVAGKRPNAFGLYDMSGNVAEWVDDCEGILSRKPLDGSALREGGGVLKPDGTRVRPAYPQCLHIVRGGHVGNYPRNVRSYRRSGAFAPTFRFALIGFRVARDLP